MENHSSDLLLVTSDDVNPHLYHHDETEDSNNNKNHLSSSSLDSSSVWDAEESNHQQLNNNNEVTNESHNDKKYNDNDDHGVDPILPFCANVNCVQHRADNISVCLLCHAKFSKDEELFVHCEIMHKSMIPCIACCSVNASSNLAFANHVYIPHFFENRTQYHKHLCSLNIHKDSFFICTQYCGMDFNCIQDLQTHISRYHESSKMEIGGKGGYIPSLIDNSNFSSHLLNLQNNTSNNQYLFMDSSALLPPIAYKGSTNNSMIYPFSSVMSSHHHMDNGGNNTYSSNNNNNTIGSSHMTNLIEQALNNVNKLPSVPGQQQQQSMMDNNTNSLPHLPGMHTLIQQDEDAKNIADSTDDDEEYSNKEGETSDEEYIEDQQGSSSEDDGSDEEYIEKGGKNKTSKKRKKSKSKNCNGKNNSKNSRKSYYQKVESDRTFPLYWYVSPEMEKDKYKKVEAAIKKIYKDEDLLHKPIWIPCDKIKELTGIKQNSYYQHIRLRRHGSKPVQIDESKLQDLKQGVYHRQSARREFYMLGIKLFHDDK